jgi:hypothetical protein
VTRPQPSSEALPCGCRLRYSAGGRLEGFAYRCEEAIAIFARHSGQPETREVSAARTADFDAHFDAQRSLR